MDFPLALLRVVILQEEDSEGDLERSHSFLILSKDDMSMVSEKKITSLIFLSTQILKYRVLPVDHLVMS